MKRMSIPSAALIRSMPSSSLSITVSKGTPFMISFEGAMKISA